MPDINDLWTIVHVFGAVLGAGGAYMSDAMFMSSVKDERFSRTELRFLRIGGRMVWLGLAILVLSGLMLVASDPARYLSSTKFLAKATIVGVIIVNGLIFHAKHIPLLFRHVGAHFPSSDEFIRNRPFILASGAVSMVSWTCAIILGMLRSLPFPYTTIVGAYAALALSAAFSAYLLRDIILPHHGHGPLHWLARLFREKE